MKYFFITFAILFIFSSCMTADNTEALDMLEVVDFEILEEPLLSVSDENSITIEQEEPIEEIIPIVDETLIAIEEPIIETEPMLESEPTLATPTQTDSAQIGSIVLPQWFCYTAGGLIISMLLAFCYISNQRHKKN